METHQFEPYHKNKMFCRRYIDGYARCSYPASAEVHNVPAPAALSAEEGLYPLKKWYTDLRTLPAIIEVTDHGGIVDRYWTADLDVYRANELFDSEKDAINAARKLRIGEIDRLQKEVNALDERYDAIEDAETNAATEELKLIDKGESKW